MTTPVLALPARRYTWDVEILTAPYPLRAKILCLPNVLEKLAFARLLANVFDYVHRLFKETSTKRL